MATGSGLMEEYDLMKQAKYRGYMSNIDKALKNFEYTSEWADLIPALGKLNKVSNIFTIKCGMSVKKTNLSPFSLSVFNFDDFNDKSAK